MISTTENVRQPRTGRRALAGVLTALALFVLGAPIPAQASPADPATWPSAVTTGLPNPYGLDFSADGASLFVAQRGVGLSRIAADGTVSTLVASADSFMAVAYDQLQDDLLVTVDSDASIYRFDLSDIAANPTAYRGDGAWRSRATIAHTMSSAAGIYVYGLEVGPDGAVYAWTYTSRSVLRIVSGVETAIITGVTGHGILDIADGQLYVFTEQGTRRAPLADLTAGAPAAFAGLQTITAPGWSGYGVALFGDERTYYRDGSGQVVQGTLTPPISAGVPTVVGRPGLGGVLTAEEGTWTAGTGFGYRWLVDGAPVPGATSRTYAPRAADAGRSVSVEVTGTRSGYTAATVVATPVTVAAAPGPVTAVAVAAGTASVVVTWTAPSTGAVATGYTVTLAPGGQTCTTTATSCRLGGTAGTAYTATVLADAAGVVGPGATSGPGDTVILPMSPPVVPTTPFRLTTRQGDVTNVQVGQQLELVGEGFLSNSTVALVVYSTPTALGTAVADGTGQVRSTVSLPVSLPAGQHSLVVAGVAADGSPRYLRMDVTIPTVAPAPAPGPEPDGTSTPRDLLAVTGFDGAVPLAGALLSLVVGSALVLAARGRRHPQS